MTKPQEIAPGVWYLGLNIANVYFIGTRESWVVVDACAPLNEGPILAAAEEVFGKGAKPAALFLTHAHFDHFGSAKALLEHWGDVPVYAHRLDAPFLTGMDKTAPGDPTVGGFFAMAYRTFPKRQGTDLPKWFKMLPSSELVPGVTGWRWFHTPGHTPGHVSLWRESDRTLIAGDAVITVNLDSLANVIDKKPTVSRPPTPATPDWDSAIASVRFLAGLRPRTLVTGHGLPMFGDGATDGLTELAQTIKRPEHGRYVHEAPIADEGGINYVPPPAPDPVGIAMGALALGGLIAWVSHRQSNVKAVSDVSAPVASHTLRFERPDRVDYQPAKVIETVVLVPQAEPLKTVQGVQLVP